jgi:NMD protein affecting ribosome stability and mRNA decay
MHVVQHKTIITNGFSSKKMDEVPVVHCRSCGQVLDPPNLWYSIEEVFTDFITLNRRSIKFFFCNLLCMKLHINPTYDLC